MLIEAAGDIMMQMDDDHHLHQDIDLKPHVKKLLEDEEASWIRLMGTAFHSFTATLRGKYWYIDWKSAGDYSLYITSNRPHIKHRRFHDFFGKYPVNLSLGETEEAFCHQCRNTAAKLVGIDVKIAIPHVLIPLIEYAWDHVGQSWQGRE